MITADSKVAPWDMFLGTDAEEKGYKTPEQRDVYLRHLRTHVEAFRVSEWKSIARQLKNEFGWDLPEGLEPMWVASGRAMLWQHQVYSRHGEEIDAGWAPTSGLPIGSAAQLATYLEKGLRLRCPPADAGVDDVEAWKLPALPPQETKEEPAPPEYQYLCDRHNKIVAFTTWKGYIRHCQTKNEEPEIAPPDNIRNLAINYSYYCPLHGKGFHSKKLATRHIQTEMGVQVTRQHPSLDEMHALTQGLKQAAKKNNPGG